MKISEDGNLFQINGAQFYPPDHVGVFQASQVSTDIPFQVLTTSLESVVTEARPVRLDASLRIIPAADGSDGKIIDFGLHIISLGGEEVTVDKVHIRLLQGDSREAGMPGLLIHDVALIRPSGTAVSWNEAMRKAIENGNAKCSNPNSFFCKLRAFIASKTGHVLPAISRKPGCHGAVRPHHGAVPALNIKGGPNKFPNARPDGSKSDHVDNVELRPSGAVNVKGGPHKFGLRPEGGELDNIVKGATRPHHRGHRGGHGGHGGHHRGHHHAHHRALHFMRQFIASFVIPVMIGVAAGMLASVLGLFVGSCVAWLWVKFVRGGRRGNASAQLVSAEETGAEVYGGEKKHLIAEEEEVVDDEPLPVYVESEKQ